MQSQTELSEDQLTKEPAWCRMPLLIPALCLALLGAGALMAMRWQRKRGLAAEDDSARQRLVEFQDDGSEDPGAGIDQMLDLHPDHLEMPHEKPHAKPPTH
ncbi:hypothetical protein SAMN04515617_101108 [Collimonas sp. OK242]|jgi:hypothetical protein|uniref:hypothetical protein n=1 Tax=Collimonas sp. OK242 TaxID=1798195 RepID=UPI0008976728|nr:hypothetical protein [Collimonas sp. OK242]SDX08531.1 hypothetical protein SAMN04515617_101108 [Collimonas sp. OK242]